MNRVGWSPSTGHHRAAGCGEAAWTLEPARAKRCLDPGTRTAYETGATQWDGPGDRCALEGHIKAIRPGLTWRDGL